MCWPGYNFKIEFYSNLGSGLLDVGYQVAPVLLLLQAGEDHLGAGDVLLGVLQVDIQGVLVPGDPLANVGRGVGEPSSSSSLPAPHTVKVGTLLVLAARLNSVALRASLCENLLACVRAHPQSEKSLVEVNQAIKA